MECPYCHALAFLGEWLTPKEMQSIRSKSCDYCTKDVPTAYLVQPKEKKRSKHCMVLNKCLKSAEYSNSHKNDLRAHPIGHI